jgi:branched-chain amino acid transport system ATP-binding protein
MKREDRGAALEAVGLSFAIGPVAIVKDFSLTLEAGHVVGLIGPNGAGKTTALDLLSGFQSPGSGRVLFNGHDVTRHPPYRRANLGLRRTFQESPAIIGLTVREHLQLAAGCSHTGPDGGAGRTIRLLEALQLEAAADAQASMLPTGARRLVDLARALVGTPRVLLLDEPYSGLSAPECALVTAEIDAAKAEGASVLVIEHRLALLRGVADTVVVLVRGSVVARGTLDHVLQTPQVREAYLGRKEPTEARP